MKQQPLFYQPLPFHEKNMNPLPFFKNFEWGEQDGGGGGGGGSKINFKKKIEWGEQDFLVKMGLGVVHIWRLTIEEGINHCFSSIRHEFCMNNALYSPSLSLECLFFFWLLLIPEIVISFKSQPGVAYKSVAYEKKM